MSKEIALLLADGYKHAHAEQFPKGLTKLVSYMTPRMSRLENSKEMVFFGLQAFCKTYLIDYFNENFFNLPEDEVVKEYTRVLDVMLGKGNYGIEKVRNLHRLQRLPITIKCLPEGTLVPMQVPCLSIENTHPDFAWVVQWCESLLSCEIWKMCNHATVGYLFRQVVNKYYDLTVDNTPKSKAMSDFGFRGLSCLQEAQKASTAWLCSFAGTSCIPAIPYIEYNYNEDNTKETFATNALSTEHAVMASNFTVDGDELTFIKRLLTEIYPNASFSMVSDTYDLYGLIDTLLPQCREEILNHNGKLLIRPDSGDICDVACTTVKKLYAQFPGETNSKGYKTLNPKIGVVYGDGITTYTAEKIYKRLMDEGYAANCIVFGAGSLSFNAFVENNELKVMTRDSFSVAIKATWGQIKTENGEKEIFIFKNPKTDQNTSTHKSFKKSQKGLCHVFKDENGKITYTDEHYSNEKFDNDLLETVFKDGKIVKEYRLKEIRDRLHNGKF